MQRTNADTGHELVLARSLRDVYSKITWRLVPVLFFCYILAYLDRINIGFAQLQMKSDLGFSDAVYGLGAGMFFISYFFFEVPSNLLLEKIGARKTITRIMVVWGLISAAMAFIHQPWSFYVLRFFLGIFEAGFFLGSSFTSPTGTLERIGVHHCYFLQRVRCCGRGRRGLSRPAGS